LYANKKKYIASRKQPWIETDHANPREGSWGSTYEGEVAQWPVSVTDEGNLVTDE
jgi:hypothetical protein